MSLSSVPRWVGKNRAGEQLEAKKPTGRSRQIKDPERIKSLGDEDPDAFQHEIAKRYQEQGDTRLASPPSVERRNRWEGVEKKELLRHRTKHRGKNLTVLGTMTQQGIGAFTSFLGGTTKEKMVSFLKEELLPTLPPGKVVVMDNLRVHHAQQVNSLFVSSSWSLLYLPPYSPEENPIEMGWSKGKLHEGKGGANL